MLNIMKNNARIWTDIHRRAVKQQQQQLKLAQHLTDSKPVADRSVHTLFIPVRFALSVSAVPFLMAGS